MTEIYDILEAAKDMIELDKKAKKIICNMFWRGGWRDRPEVSREDFLYGKEKGLMFEPFSSHHDSCIARLKEAARTISRENVGRAFLASLSTRALHLRSAIASWTFAGEIEAHPFSPYISSRGDDSAAYLCGTCQQVNLRSRERYEEEDLNVLQFERIKWGGIRLHHAVYCMVDLEQFAQIPPIQPGEKDWEIWGRILEVIEKVPDGDGPRQLEQALADVFPSSKAERDVVVEILAVVGVLQPGPGDRPLRGGKNDWVFAANWRGEDGYSQKQVQMYFPKY